MSTLHRERTDEAHKAMEDAAAGGDQGSSSGTPAENVMSPASHVPCGRLPSVESADEAGGGHSSKHREHRLLQVCLTRLPEPCNGYFFFHSEFLPFHWFSNAHRCCCGT